MSSPPPEWSEIAWQRIAEWQAPKAGWGYRAGSAPHAEPTSLLLLALAGHARATPAAVEAAAWLATLQQPNGSIAPSESLPEPAWSTAPALLAWAAHAAEPRARARALEFLVEQRGVAVSDPDAILGHDPAIPGWPWVDGTSPWLEPTAWAVLALTRCGVGWERARQGIDMIVDRAVPSGGWNYGNSVVLGTTLRAQPGPTGLALLALAAADHEEDDSVRGGLSLLERELPLTRAPQSLCWGALAWSAWRGRLEAGDAWLRESFERTLSRPDPALQTAYLLLAAAPDALGVLTGLAGPAVDGRVQRSRAK